MTSTRSEAASEPPAKEQKRRRRRIDKTDEDAGERSHSKKRCDDEATTCETTDAATTEDGAASKLDEPNASLNESDKIIAEHVFVRIIAYQRTIFFLFYIVGIAWLLANPFYSNNTYFSENALLPGMVASEFDDDHSIDVLYRRIVDVRNNRSLLRDLITDELQRQRIDAYRQPYAFVNPILPNHFIDGDNVYGIMRGRRASGTESILLSTDISDSASVAILLALAADYQQRIYWAKDVIFLFADGGVYGGEAWIESYLGVPSSYLIKSHLPARAGAIQAAINVQMPSMEFAYADLRCSGINGLTANLDLLNVARKLCDIESIPATIQDVAPDWHPRADSLDEFVKAQLTLFRMIGSLASSNGSGIHQAFLRYGVQALTLGARPARGTVRILPSGTLRLTRVIEGMTRSLNNLLEKTHQSFFFYLLNGKRQFVSIAYYMPAAGIILWPLASRTIHLWASASADESEQFAVVRTGSYVPALLATVCSHLYCLFYYVLLSSSSTTLRVDLCELAVASLAAFTLLGAAAPALFARLAVCAGDRHLYRSGALLQVGIVVGCVAMLNFSMAFLLSVAIVPAACLATVPDSESKTLAGSRAVRITAGALVLACHPVALLAIFCFVVRFLAVWSPDVAFSDALSMAVGSSDASAAVSWEVVTKMLSQAALSQWTDSFLLGNALLPISLLLLWPSWMLMWTSVFL